MSYSPLSLLNDDWLPKHLKPLLPDAIALAPSSVAK
jgi:hypothetical protein